MSYTLWNYQYYLGRYPESQYAFEAHEVATKGNFELLRDKFIHSEEYQKSQFDIPRPLQGTFFLPRSEGTKICVLGNCQGPNIAMTIAAIAKDPISVCGLEIMDIRQNREKILSLIKQSDIVVCCKTYSPEYADVSPETIRESYRKETLEYSPVHFTGIHPDILTLGSYGQRVRSPLGDYNSRIVLSSYVSSLSSEACLNSFNQKTYESAEYFNEFKWSSEVMKEREANLGPNGIKIADWFLTEIREKPLLYSVNHPNSRVFIEYAKSIMDMVGIKYDTSYQDMIYNTLIPEIRWPVDPIISNFHNINYHTNNLYWKNNIALPIDEFIFRSYKAYDHYGRDFLSNIMTGKIIKF